MKELNDITPSVERTAANESGTSSAVADINAIWSKHQTTFLPKANTMLASRSPYAYKRANECRQLGDQIAAEVLTRFDEVDVKEDENARKRRKECIVSAQGLLEELDNLESDMRAIDTHKYKRSNESSAPPQQKACPPSSKETVSLSSEESFDETMDMSNRSVSI